jgi:hypothetical protein
VKFNLANTAEAERAFEYLTQLVGKESLAEVKKISPTRSLNQNSYLHLLIGAFAAHFGYELEEAKQIYKELSPSIYKYEKKGRDFWRSSADLTKEEMAKSIDRFREASAAQDFPLPTATDQGWLREIENAIEQSSYYL